MEQHVKPFSGLDDNFFSMPSVKRETSVSATSPLRRAMLRS